MLSLSVNRNTGPASLFRSRPLRSASAPLCAGFSGLLSEGDMIEKIPHDIPKPRAAHAAGQRLPAVGPRPTAGRRGAKGRSGRRAGPRRACGLASRRFL